MNEDRKNPVTGERNSSPKLRYTSFHTEKKLQVHLSKHLYEYEGFTPEMYVERATELLCAKVDGKKILGFTDRAGFIYRYDIKVNDFAIGHFGGSISTLYKPPRGLDYYEEQRKQHE